MSDEGRINTEKLLAGMTTNTCFIGDCRDTMRRLIADGVRVQMCVTSPPYWGLRDYGVEGQLGLEPTPEEYVTNMVEVFRLVRDLLSDDGVLWLNLGDSYTSGGRDTFGPVIDGHKQATQSAIKHVKRAAQPVGLKPKDLVGIPWRVAFALQADGWWLRQDIIWQKPNPMPESVTDRCTKSHEYFFLLAKRERYYFDAKAIAEPAECDRMRGPALHPCADTNGNGGLSRRPLNETRNRRSVWTIATQPYNGCHFATFPPALIEPCILAGSRPGDVVLDPFFGSGTTGEVCERLGRRWIGCELNPDYGELAADRTAQQGLVLV